MTFQSNFNQSDEISSQNFAHNMQQIAQLQEITQLNQMAGGAESVRRHLARGKLLAEDRIKKLLDPSSPFLEIGAIAGYQLYGDEQVPRGGMVAGIGLVHGVACMVIANDATIKGGSYYPITIKKHLRAQRIAYENRLPCIYLVDSGGANLPRQDEVFPDREHFGRIFYHQAQMSRDGIPQIAVVMGSCTAGGAYVPAMSDHAIIVKNQGTIFLAGPPLVKAAIGEIISAEELGGADTHTKISGVADEIAQNDDHALALARRAIANCNHPTCDLSGLAEVIEPIYPSADLLSLAPMSPRSPLAVREVIVRIVDGSIFDEFKPDYGTTLVTCFASIGGIKVGIVANEGVLMAESALKASHFLQLCEQRGIAVLFLQNITGFMVGKDAEWGGIAKHGAKMVNAVASLTVPKITLIIGGSFGAGNYGMCGRAFDPRFLFAWCNAQVAVMGGEQAGDTMAQIWQAGREKSGIKVSKDEYDHYKKPMVDKFTAQTRAFYGSARLWDDGIINPIDTRKTLSFALRICHHERQAHRFGIFRM